MSLVARHLETAGFVTVVVGSARDIVEQAGVPRFVFTDFPLGNSMGVPWDRPMQSNILELALQLAEKGFAPATTITAPFDFDDDGLWRNSFMELTTEQLRAAGDARRKKRANRKSK